MPDTALIVCEWTGEAFEPLAVSRKRCDELFCVHERYRLEVREDRSIASHNQYFAALHEGWLNLPEHYAERFPTDEHLRKWLLIKCGYRDERSIVTGSKAEAQRLAGFIRPLDDYAVVRAQEAVVTVYTAKSQSMRAMGKKVFQESKQAVLDELSAMIGAVINERGAAA